jgi:hypothetical protein
MHAEALSLAGIQTLSFRRNAASMKFIANIKPSNPLYPLIHKQLPTSDHTYLVKIWKNSQTNNSNEQTDFRTL